MQSTKHVKGDIEERYRQLAGEVVIRMIEDVKLLNRREILNGLVPMKMPKRRLINGDGYKSKTEVYDLVDAIKGKSMEIWLAISGVGIGHKDLSRRLSLLTPKQCWAGENRKFANRS